MIEIVFLNNNGTDFAETIYIPEGTTIGGLFSLRMGEGADPTNYFIRLNRQPARASTVLSAGDNVSVVPSKITGA